ncbi:LOW QUALITY PROTEIN: solute carrier family 15 member 5 [Hipposideros larvatus]
MPVIDSKITEEKVPLNHGIEKEKTIRHIGYFYLSYSMKKNWAGICLLLVELCERFTFFEVICNMIPFCTVKPGYCNYQAAILNLCFIGTSRLTPVFAGWFADVCLGRNKLVYSCLFLHFLGTALLSMAAFPLEDFYIGTHTSTAGRNRLFYTALLAICLGTGGIRAIVCPLGAYSLQKIGSQNQTSFVNWFDWIMNLNAAVVFLGTAYIQHLVAWALVLLPFMSTLTTLITLHMMHNLIYQPGKCCAFLAFGVFVNALKTCRLQYCHLHGDVISWLDHGSNNGGCYSKLVEGTKFFFTLLPLFIFQLLYKMCIIQIPSGYYLQTMNSILNLGGFLLPIAVMNVIRIRPLLILAPCMEYFSTCLFRSKRDGPFLQFSVISYRFVPSTMRGNFMSLLTFNGFGCFTGALLVELVYLISEGNWFPNTLNKGNLESFFFFLASLTLLNVLGFWSISQRYCNLNHFNAQNISGSNLEETLLLHEKSLKFYGSTQEFSSSIDFGKTAL